MFLRFPGKESLSAAASCRVSETLARYSASFTNLQSKSFETLSVKSFRLPLDRSGIQMNRFNNKMSYEVQDFEF